MRLVNARLCLDCEEVHEEQHCPICGSESFAFMTRWVTPSDTIGADGPGGANAPVTGFWTGPTNAGTAGVVGGAALQGTYGTLQLDAAGGYTYTVTDADGVPAGVQDTFTYEITDGDGSVSYAQLVIDLDQDTRVPTIGDVAESVDEAGLDFASLTVDDFQGTDPASDAEKVLNGDLGINANGETFKLFVGATEIVADGTVIAGTHGTLTIDRDGSYTYVLNVEADHQADPTPTDEFAIKVVDATGDEDSDTLVISIVDDAPVARDDADHVAEAQNSTTTPQNRAVLPS